MHYVLIPTQINAAGLPQFLELIGKPFADDAITLDFRALRRVSPAGLVALVATVKRWQNEGIRVSVQGIAECVITGYLQRMNVMKILDVELPEHFKRHEAKGRFVPVQLIEVTVEDLGTAIAGCIAPGGDEYERPLSALYDFVWYVLTEIAMNARQHSRGEGYACAQVTQQDGFVRLGLADNGMGILQSFREAGFAWSAEIDDCGAIRKALEPFVSSKGSPINEGVGLTLVSQLARLTQGHLLIVSGRGELTVDPKGSVTTRDLREEAAFQGTLLALTIPQRQVHDFAALLNAAKIGAGLLPRPDSPARFQ